MKSVERKLFGGGRRQRGSGHVRNLGTRQFVNIINVNNVNAICSSNIKIYVSINNNVYVNFNSINTTNIVNSKVNIIIKVGEYPCDCENIFSVLSTYCSIPAKS